MRRGDAMRRDAATHRVGTHISRTYDAPAYLRRDVWWVIVWMFRRHVSARTPVRRRILVVVIVRLRVLPLDDERLPVRRIIVLREMQPPRLVTVSHAVIALGQQDNIEDQRDVQEGRTPPAGHLA